jgi:heptaprenyl diphosphate synthase
VITAVPVDFPDTAVEADVLEGMALVESAMREATQAGEPMLTEASLHLVEAGGKRFRAMLVLLAGQFGNPRDPRIVSAAAAIELTHLATLFHDDVMDEAAMRRGHPSANSRWNNTVAILTGDFLFARASQILAELGAEAIRIQTDTFARLVSGQMAETIGPRPGEDPLDHYWRVVTEKTGSLIATSGRFGAMFAEASRDVIAHIEPACEALGVAFQISDDILDIASESGQSGKTPGTDLREGVRSLPVLHAMRSADPADERLHELLARGPLTEEAAHAEALTLLRAHRGMEAARADLIRWSERARKQILALPPVWARTAFEKMCNYVVERTA